MQEISSCSPQNCNSGVNFEFKVEILVSCFSAFFVTVSFRTDPTYTPTFILHGISKRLLSFKSKPNAVCHNIPSLTYFRGRYINWIEWNNHLCVSLTDYNIVTCTIICQTTHCMFKTKMQPSSHAAKINCSTCCTEVLDGVKIMGTDEKYRLV